KELRQRSVADVHARNIMHTLAGSENASGKRRRRQFTRRCRNGGSLGSRVCRTEKTEGGQPREKIRDSLGDHRCAGSVRNCRAGIGASRAIVFHTIWV